MLPVALEEARRDIDLQLGGERLHRLDAGVLVQRRGGREGGQFLRLAKIRPFEQFRRQDDLGAMLRRLADMRSNGLNVRSRVGGKVALDRGDGDVLGHASILRPNRAATATISR